MSQLGSPRFHFETATSTSDRAKTAVSEGVAEGALFTADHQTKGRGRRGATWADEPGQSALMSFVLYPDLPLADIWVVSFAASLAACEALQGMGAPARIKWPNDIVLQGRKVAGVLVETAVAPKGGFAAIVGIGINVGQARFDINGNYAVEPVSLVMQMGPAAPMVAQVIEQVTERLSHRYGECAPWEDRRQMLLAWRANLDTGQMQTGIYLDSNLEIRGILKDARLSDGAALLEQPDGTLLAARPAGTPSEAANQV